MVYMGSGLYVCPSPLVILMSPKNGSQKEGTPSDPTVSQHPTDLTGTSGITREPPSLATSCLI